MSPINGSHRRRTHHHHHTLEGRRKPVKTNEPASLVQLLLLPLSFVAFLLLHVTFTVIQHVRSYRYHLFKSSQNRASQRTLLEELLRQSSLQRSRHADTSTANEGSQPTVNGTKKQTSSTRIPTHLAITFPSTSPTTSHLVLQAFARRLGLAVDKDSNRTASARAEELSRTQYQACKEVLGYAALVGIGEVSIWDERGDLEEMLQEDAAYDGESGRWTLVVGLPSPSTGRPMKKAVIIVDVLDGARRVQLAREATDPTSKTFTNGTTQALHIGNGQASSSSNGSLQYQIKLNLLQQSHDGRSAFVSTSATLARDRLRQPSQVQPLHPDGPIRVDVPALNAHLHASLGLPLVEPHLLFVLTPGGSGRAKTMGDFPRWMVRVTEIAHLSLRRQQLGTRGSISRQQGGNWLSDDEEDCQSLLRMSSLMALGNHSSVLSVEEFLRGWEQFQRAEQRYGK